MAMKIGREYSSEKVTPKDFERLAEETGLARPSVRSRVSELAEIVLAGLKRIDMTGEVAEAIAVLIRERCEKFGKRF